MALVGERALSGLAVAAFPLAKNTGLAHTFATAADRVNVRRALAVLCAALAAALLALGGWALVLAAAGVFVRYYFVAKKQFGEMCIRDRDDDSFADHRRGVCHVFRPADAAI